ncbi:MAG: dihydroflavonol-4-reductase [Bacteroidia bacterium]|jgi:dihydroflavonol-4-reductase
MKIFLTGADGLLGNNLVRRLLEKEYTVKVFIQKGKKLDYLEGCDVEVFYGDILNYDELNAAMAGSDVVIHAAALTNTWPNTGKLYYTVNVDGTANVIKAVQANKVARLLHIGTSNSFGAGSKDNPGTETNPFVADKYGLDYITSKYVAHELVLKHVKEDGLPAVILNPTFMIGPFDVKPSSGKMLLSVATGKVPGYAAGGRNFVYVNDVANAIVNAITKGRIGEGYILGSTNLSYQEMFTKTAKIFGTKAPTLRIPPFATSIYGGALSLFGKLFKFEPVVSYPLARISNEDHYYSCAKAVKELDMPQTDLDFAINEAKEWFIKEGYYTEK